MSSVSFRSSVCCAVSLLKQSTKICATTAQNWVLFDPSYLKKCSLEIEFLKYSAILLNGPSSIADDVWRVWEHASFRVCADGGINRVFAYEDGNKRIVDVDAIVGDMDSAKPRLLRAYGESGTSIVRAINQDAHDLSKAVDYTLAQRGENETIIVLDPFSSRLDHSLANLHTLATLPSRNIAFLSSTSMTIALPKGEHVLHWPAVRSVADLCPSARGCGIAAASASYCTTQGLKWNLHGDLLQLDKLVSR
mmetsp:Transcript_10169/g.26652  ORF Transcript_10169/g.26652 Transcript_10169/m.26652 type:complete len:250 (-) Transcript_10169:758-1507(-)